MTVWIVAFYCNPSVPIQINIFFSGFGRVYHMVCHLEKGWHISLSVLKQFVHWVHSTLGSFKKAIEKKEAGSEIWHWWESWKTTLLSDYHHADSPKVVPKGIMHHNKVY